MGGLLRDDPHWCLPAHGRACFDMLPATVLQALTGSAGSPTLDLGGLAGRYERALMVYFDAFGWRWYERHAEHPLLRHAREHGVVSKLTSQFPSTTAAHMTTIHSGMPVGIHGVYEWFTLLPMVNRIVAPLLFSFAGDKAPGTLLPAGVTAADIYPEADFLRALRESGVDAQIAFPSELAGGPPSQMLRPHARVHAFNQIEDGVETIGGALAGAPNGYGFLYLPDVDAEMHRRGPDHPSVDRLISETLDRLHASLFGGALPEGTLVLLTADHGMDGIDPERSIYVNELWPGIAEAIAVGADGRPLAPAGSSRDLFLHTRPGSREEVHGTLQTLLEGRAEVVAVEDAIEQGLFGPRVGERFRERVADIVVLPYPGEAVYWHDPPRFTQPYYGQHGGLSHAEMELPLVAFVT